MDDKIKDITRRRELDRLGQCLATLAKALTSRSASDLPDPGALDYIATVFQMEVTSRREWLKPRVYSGPPFDESEDDED